MHSSTLVQTSSHFSRPKDIMKTQTQERKTRKQAILELLRRDAYTVADLVHLSKFTYRVVVDYIKELERGDLIHACEEVTTQLSSRVLAYRAGPRLGAKVFVRRDYAAESVVARLAY